MLFLLISFKPELYRVWAILTLEGCAFPIHMVLCLHSESGLGSLWSMCVLKPPPSLIIVFWHILLLSPHAFSIPTSSHRLNQLFVDQSELMENIFYIMLSQGPLNHAIIQTVDRCLGIEIII